MGLDLFSKPFINLFFEEIRQKMIAHWLQFTLITLSAATLIAIVIVFLLIRKKCSKPTTPLEYVDTTFSERSHTQDDQEISHQNASLYKSSVSGPRKFFDWADYPSLVTHAVENGWPRFAFVPSPSDSNGVEMSWEVFEESAEHMQKIRLNHELRESTTARDPLSVIRTALPLPGPRFVNASFPHEAYFEIKVLPNHEQVEATNVASDDSYHSRRNKIEEMLFGGKQENVNESVIALGLMGGGGHLPLKVPGSFQGSIGFNSSGSVFLDGTKLVEESKREGWGRAGNVVGCGYNPAQKKVFFTVNSRLVIEIRCKSEEYEHPLYPAIAASTEISVAVNLGQSPFKFEAANSRRSPNPCFVTTYARSSNNTGPLYELDSKELFSMGRIDGKWNQYYRSTTPRATSQESLSNVEGDQLSETELFEITGK